MHCTANYKLCNNRNEIHSLNCGLSDHEIGMKKFCFNAVNAVEPVFPLFETALQIFSLKCRPINLHQRSIEKASFKQIAMRAPF